MDKKLPGCFVYTSSASAVLPSPFSVSYAATKVGQGCGDVCYDRHADYLT